MICAACRTFRSDRASEIAAHQRQPGACQDPWGQVVEARSTGDLQRADRLTRRILGVVEPMSEEAKEKLRAYAEAHKDEIREKAKRKRELRRRLLALTKVKRK